MLARVKPSISHVYAFVGMNGTAEELGLRGSNLWALSVKSKTYEFKGAALQSALHDKHDMAWMAWQSSRPTTELTEAFRSFRRST